MNKNVSVNVMCGKFLTKDEFTALFQTYGIKEDDMTTFMERDECVFCCEAERNGVTGMALFY